MIKENIEQIEERICAACRRAGRDRSEVSLICVTKTKPVEMLQEAYDAGQRDFGENKVQEICRKNPELPSDIRWHMIGHLQRNKVRQLIGQTAMIHSVDSLRLAQTISSEALRAGERIPVLIEVNMAGEESKFGVAPEEAAELVRAASELEGIRISGLMTIAPYTENPETNRPYFSGLRELAVDIGQKCIDNVSMSVLSMGMTGDFEVAIEEGATHIRVGTGIFGERIASES
ncbi:MAG: YggS family pyridoxal phosphate-dependent enzyme [Lachnospiraceae bacterium]|nr:YggS family pyridoxal phosphate-dependent enzyme [Lachnospiraceae bacterium]